MPLHVRHPRPPRRLSDRVPALPAPLHPLPVLVEPRARLLEAPVQPRRALPPQVPRPPAHPAPRPAPIHRPLRVDAHNRRRRRHHLPHHPLVHLLRPRLCPSFIYICRIFLAHQFPIRSFTLLSLSQPILVSLSRRPPCIKTSCSILDCIFLLGLVIFM